MEFTERGHSFSEMSRLFQIDSEARAMLFEEAQEVIARKQCGGLAFGKLEGIRAAAARGDEDPSIRSLIRNCSIEVAYGRDIHRSRVSLGLNHEILTPKDCQGSG